MSKEIKEFMMSDSSNDEDMNLTPPELVQTVHNAELSFLPERSREKYLKAYDLFNTWRHSKGAKTFSENIILSYFIELSNTRKASTLWSIYSMLKATIKTKKDIHIEKYHKLLAFLKKTSSGHKPKKSKIFTASNIEHFLNEAPDSKFLATKVVLIIGVSGACRTNELTYLTTKNIEKHSKKLLLVKLPKTNIERNFVIRDEYVTIIDKYLALRPANTSIDRFFLQYRNGKCVRQPMGCTKIGGLPREIATFLGLQDPEQYTGHCFRRTSAALLADSGADLTMLKRHGGWKSSSMADGYIEDSIKNKSKISNNIIGNSKVKESEPAATTRRTKTASTKKDEKSTNLPHCDECKRPVDARELYRCVQCPLVVMCADCGRSNAHAHHCVLRMPSLDVYNKVELFFELLTDVFHKKLPEEDDENSNDDGDDDKDDGSDDDVDVEDVELNISVRQEDDSENQNQTAISAVPGPSKKRKSSASIKRKASAPKPPDEASPTSRIKTEPDTDPLACPQFLNTLKKTTDEPKAKKTKRRITIENPPKMDNATKLNTDVVIEYIKVEEQEEEVVEVKLEPLDNDTAAGLASSWQQ